jgi:hypothetical protein
MELTVYNSENTKAPNKGMPSLHVNVKSGLLSFNNIAAEIMALGEESKLSFGYSEKDKTWFAFKADNGFVGRKEKDKYGWRCNNVSMARLISDENKRFMIACGGVITEGEISYYPIINIQK